MWFLQVESQFQIHNVSSDTTKYHLVVSTLDHETIGEVSDVIRSPPASEKYSGLKTAILSRLTDSPDAQLHKLLTDVQLGDKRPSQLLRHMRTLAGSRVGDDLLRIKWLDLLPQHTRRMLLLIKNQTLEELAAVADEVHDLGPSVMATSHRTSSAFSPERAQPSLAEPNDHLAQQLASLSLAVAQLTAITREALGEPSFHRQRGRSASRDNQKPRTRSSTPAGNPRTGHCWYHANFGTRATKCRQPCSFANSVDSTSAKLN